MTSICSPGTLEIWCFQCFQRCRGQHFCPGNTGHEMCNNTVGINSVHYLNLHTVSLHLILFLWLMPVVLCRYIQAVRRLKAEGRRLSRTVHLMFVPGGVLYCLFKCVLSFTFFYWHLNTGEERYKWSLSTAPICIKEKVKFLYFNLPNVIRYKHVRMEQCYDKYVTIIFALFFPLVSRWRSWRASGNGNLCEAFRVPEIKHWLCAGWRWINNCGWINGWF